MRPPPSWALAVFTAAFAARLGFSLLVDQPLLYTHQYHYFFKGLALASHPDPVRYVLTSDEWRAWGDWTIAPLYHLFLGSVFALFGPHLVPLRILQSALDALAAVGVAALGRQAAGSRGWWAGLAYAVWWPAVELPSWTMTENLHNVLFVWALAALSRLDRASPRRGFAAGVLLGFSALARSVSTGFLALACLWRWSSAGRGWAGVRAAAPIALGGLLVILPWTARNALLAGDAVLIESAAFENIWFANNFADPPRRARQQEILHSAPTPADRRQVALLFAYRGVTRHPDMFAEKVGVNFWHFFRPEGLHSLVHVQRTLEPWRHAGSVLLDDLLSAALVPLACVFLLGRGSVPLRASPVRALIGLWVAYYLLMVVVIFHNEARYRSAFIPFIAAAAAGGVAVLADPARRRSVWTWGPFGLGLAVVVLSLRPYAGPGVRDLRASLTMRRAETAVARGAIQEGWTLAETAASRAPTSARVWYDLGKALHLAGETGGALASYRKGEPLGVFANWRGALGAARLVPIVEGGPAGLRAVRRVDGLSWDADPWLVLEMAWRELPPPRTDEVLLARNDYGAVRGFYHPRGLDSELSARRRDWTRYEERGGPQPPPGPHRWTRHRAWVRLLPVTAAPAYDVTVEMGSPFPSPNPAPVVAVRGNDGVVHALTVASEVRPYGFRVAVPRGEPLVIRIDAPVWSRDGEPADQGVRVDRVSVRAAP